MYHDFNYSSFDPMLRLWVQGVPGWQIVGHHPPECTRTDDLVQAIEDFSQSMNSLERFLGRQSLVQGYK